MNGRYAELVEDDEIERASQAADRFQFALELLSSSRALTSSTVEKNRTRLR